MRHLRDFPPWRWRRPAFFTYMAVSLAASLMVDSSLGYPSQWAVLGVAAGCYILPAAAAGGIESLVRRARGKGRAA